jgi:hypothetical protein
VHASAHAAGVTYALLAVLTAFGVGGAARLARVVQRARATAG